MNTTAKSANVHVVAMVEQIASTEMPPLERAEALIEIALDLQKQPKDPQDLHDALYLYERAAEWTADHRLATARVHAGRGAALRRLPGSGLAELEQARDAFEDALPVLRADGEAEELAEVEMSFGLVLQALAAANRATLPDAIAAYQRALRTFGKHAYPREYAILHNNLATAYLSMKLSPEKDVMREAMAVQSFRQALEVVTLLEDPSEYAMLQNNLGNALQAMRTAHPLENLRRAVEAYDEALKVRTPYDTPVEFANTATNKANALMNLPDDPDDHSKGNPRNLGEAIDLLGQAQAIFTEHYLPERAQIVGQLRAELAHDLGLDLSQISGANAQEQER